MIACDSVGWKGPYRGGCFRKITRSRTGALAGAAGEAGCIQRFLRWVDDGCDHDKPPELEKDAFDGFVVTPTGGLIGYSHLMLPFVIEAEFYGEGSGYGVALGALVMGAGAERAVHIACEYSDSCRGPVQTLRL